jgi:ATP/maltotriose-dependent transcriptional regulator MalT
VLKVGGRFAEAITVAFEGASVARRLGFLAFLGTHLLCNAADLLFIQGRWRESESAVREVEQIGPYGINEILVRELVARLALVRGQLDLAEQELDAVAPRAARTRDRQCIGPVQASLAELALWQHRPAEALQAAVDGIELVGQGGALTHAPLLALALRGCADLAVQGRARRSDGMLADAVRQGTALVESARAQWTEIHVRRPALEPQSQAWTALSEAEWSRLEGQSDPHAWATAADHWERLGQPYSAAYARFREAEALVASHSDRSRASAALGQAVEQASLLGAEPLREEAEALARRARLATREGAPADGGPAAHAADETGLGLTARELEVLALVAAGLSNRQIGEQLFISEKTASVHVSNILGKLGVAGRGEAAVMAHRLGLV